ncbi:alpha/beta hydrolase [Neobacillus niacini]|uniref:alpha/beta hydrolase n=1 Tax=Neobacillus niacini TaxID=86668 RepID=UPI0028560CC0|nr:alpha/beta hydrolase [Neobacillus niacini]MDR7003047.1 alpha-beta hydrolase superfamily lysophospholipase [Neobacillus niacini]
MVQQSTYTFETNDDIKIHVSKWEGEERPWAIVQIAHGMAEHIERYHSFATELVSKNMVVFGNDHRGHGKTGSLNNCSGYFADEQGFEKVVEDMFTLTTIIEKEYPDIPIFLFGHSMGSFLSRRYIQLKGDRIAGVILSGTGGDPGIMGKIGRMIASRQMKKMGRKTPSPLLNNLTFGNYNKSFRQNRTEFDWLSRDEREVDLYIEDPNCGGIFSSGFFHDLFGGLETINKATNIGSIPKELPIYLISGSMDPVGGNTKGVLKTYQAHKNAGIIDVSYKFYEDARHEILNEINKDEVVADIIGWIKGHLK